MSNTKPDPFIASGISLGVPNSDAQTIENLDNVLFLDEDGNLHFKDSWISQQTYIDGSPIQTVTLKDLWTRINGIYVKDGKLYFKDSSVSRSYSLKEIVDSYTNFKNKLTNGGIWWIGRTSINNSECNNIMVDLNGDPNLGQNVSGGRVFTKTGGSYPSYATGTKCFSIDQYLSETTFTDGDYKTDSSGDLRWHDVPNLKLIIPPFDSNKTFQLIAKTSLRLINIESPILFRLYDKTTETVLDSISLSNGGMDPSSQQQTLTFYGEMTTYTDEFNRLNCSCPTTQQQESSEEEPSHELQVQFYINDQLSTNIFIQGCEENPSGSGVCQLDDTTTIKYDYLERRLIGVPNGLSNEPINNSSIDCIIFDTTKSDKLGRKSGNISFNNQDLYKITFKTPFSDSNYSISLSCNKNINMFYSNKTSSGFTIRAEKKFTGTVDWIATKLAFEGDA